MVTKLRQSLAMLLVMAWTAGCQEPVPPDPDPGFAERLKAGVRTVGDGRLVLKDHTQFAWDRVYFFGPYSRAERIDSIVGKRVAHVSAIEWRDTETFFVFLMGDSVAKALDIGNDVGNFTYLGEVGPFTPSTAVFTARLVGNLSGGEPNWELHLVREPLPN